MTPLLPLFTSLAHSCPYLSISIHYTRAQRDEKNDNSSNSSDQTVPPIAVHAGRPGRMRIVSIMESAITRATTSSGSPQSDARGMLVGVCGPQGMNHDVAVAVNSISSKLRTQIGGVEIHQECVHSSLILVTS